MHNSSGQMQIFIVPDTYICAQHHSLSLLSVEETGNSGAWFMMIHHHSKRNFLNRSEKLYLRLVYFSPLIRQQELTGSDVDIYKLK